MAIFKSGAARLNRIVGSMHEHAGPKFTKAEIEKYGIGNE
jgi:hypothetical protein